MAQPMKYGWNVEDYAKARALAYTDQLPTRLRGEIIAEIVDRYVNKLPPDEAGFVHVAMVGWKWKPQNPGAAFLAWKAVNSALTLSFFFF